MSGDVFAEAIEQAHVWVGELAEALGVDKARAYRDLRATLHAIRDRLTVNSAAHLSAQLPLVVRGFYFEGWEPAACPVKMHAEEFVERVRADAMLATSDEAEGVIRAVVGLMWEHLTPGAMDHVGEELPADLQKYVY